MSRPIDCVPALRKAGLDAMAEWASTRPVRHGWKGRTCRELWNEAPHGNWLLKYAHRAGADQRDIVRTAAACVRPVLRFVPAGEDRPRLAIEAAERWADEPTDRNRADWWRAEGEAFSAMEKMRRDHHRYGERAAAAITELLGGETLSAGNAAWSAAVAFGKAEGLASQVAAHRACAEEVRRLVPFLDLSAAP